MQKEIQLTDKTLLVVSVPKEASNLVVDGNGSSTVRLSFYENGWDWIPIPKGNYKFSGIYPELTEEQAKMVVDYGFCSTNGCELFECYTDEESVCSTALESFQSLMERENITGYDKYAILIKSK